MAKALGNTQSEETVPNASKISQLLQNNVGLVLSNQPLDSLFKYFDDLKFKDYARQGQHATSTFILKQGILKRDDLNFISSMEPLFRKLGLPTELQKGQIHLREDFVVCEKGDLLDQNKCLILKHFGEMMSEFKIVPIATLGLKTGEFNKLD